MTMRMALKESAAPVIYSHSSARALVDHPRDVPDDVLRLVGAKGGVVMVNFAPGYDSDEGATLGCGPCGRKSPREFSALRWVYIGQPDQRESRTRCVGGESSRPRATLSQVADHAEHIRMIAGIDHVGLGSDFDGIANAPIGLEGVDKFPALLRELMRRGWSDADIGKIAGENVLRVLTEAEKVAARLRSERAASEAVIESGSAQH